MKTTVLVAASIALQLAGCPRRELPSERRDGPRAADGPPAAETVSPPAPGAAGGTPLAQPPGPHPAFAERTAERHAFVRKTIEERDITDPRVLTAMRKVPRHRFVPQSVASDAYTDRPLPIGGGQTISQPYIVAFMTEAAQPKADAKCLEIGTGSGYQAAVLAEVCARVYSIEYLPDVAEFGKSNLRELGYGPERVELRTGDGYRGWPEAAPFDVILVTAAPESVPEPLLDQLGMGGRLIIPVGPQHDAQELERWTRKREGKGVAAFERERLMGVRFVPFLGSGKQ